jgi:CRISPR system Cascade subunit CasD
MSFGAPLVDQHGFTLPFPGRAMLAGLLANALGYEHADFTQLTQLQDGISYAARRDRSDAPLVDFQTVFLGRAHMRQGGWTTWGRSEERSGGSPQETHIRYRHYQVDAAYTVALETMTGAPTLPQLEQALRRPARPLFIGRKCCLPSVPLLLPPGRVEAKSVLGALDQAPLARGSGRELAGLRLCWWPDEPGLPRGGRVVAVTDDRDWENQIHVGRRYMQEGLRSFAVPEHAKEEIDAR